MRKAKELLDILLGAMARETEAFNYYHKASQSSPYDETKALLVQLSLEERKHREILAGEYVRIKRLISSKGKEYIKREKISFAIPSELPYLRVRTIPGIEVAAIDLPSRFLGGDYIDTFPIILGKKKLLGVVIYDVMGHGTDATGLKAVTQKTLNGIKETLKKEEIFNLSNPAWLVSQVNRKLWKECRQRGSFVSFFYVVIDPIEGKLIYTSAGHQPAILTRRQNRESETLSDSELLVGVEREREYTQSSLDLSWGDLILLFTDGVVETLNSKQEEYGTKRLAEFLKKNSRSDLPKLLLKICQDLKKFNQGKSFKDEVSMIALRIEKEKNK
ncbi:MAG: SpoIIE family protein phosphatase [candidate division Zixibacteria bacterium]|nr:SpoIIE family protein phosphatase [candidate division Zixibacteria bacterium]